MDLASGIRIGDFILERQIGAGGVGAVWAARDSTNGSAVALKILRPSDPSSADVLRARLLREAHATRRIAHPAIVPVLDVLDHDDSPVLVMELLEGETLRQKLIRERKLSLPETSRLLAPIAEALSVAHAAGIVHRDLKPENIFLERGEQVRVRLLDFGVARFFEPPESSDQVPLTGLGTLIGTLAYMAPEQAMRPSECGHEVDVWALGIILYEALSGCRPIEGASGPETMRQLLVGGITPLEVMVQGLPSTLTDLVSSMLRRTPERRPRDLREIAKHLYEHALAA
jgi:eukaryotic-like serine/threonine-protein kinase